MIPTPFAPLPDLVDADGFINAGESLFGSCFNDLYSDNLSWSNAAMAYLGTIIGDLETYNSKYSGVAKRAIATVQRSLQRKLDGFIQDAEYFVSSSLTAVKSGATPSQEKTLLADIQTPSETPTSSGDTTNPPISQGIPGNAEIPPGEIITIGPPPPPVCPPGSHPVVTVNPITGLFEWVCTPDSGGDPGNPPPPPPPGTSVAGCCLPEIEIACEQLQAFNMILTNATDQLRLRAPTTVGQALGEARVCPDPGVESFHAFRIANYDTDYAEGMNDNWGSYRAKRFLQTATPTQMKAGDLLQLINSGSYSNTLDGIVSQNISGSTIEDDGELW